MRAAGRFHALPSDKRPACHLPADFPCRENPAKQRILNCKGESPKSAIDLRAFGDDFDVCPVRWFENNPEIAVIVNYWLALSGRNPTEGIKPLTPLEYDKQPAALMTAIEAVADGFMNEHNRQMAEIAKKARRRQ